MDKDVVIKSFQLGSKIFYRPGRKGDLVICRKRLMFICLKKEENFYCITRKFSFFNK
jgi:hypothetical protein